MEFGMECTTGNPEWEEVGLTFFLLQGRWGLLVYYHHSDWHIKWVYFCHVLKRWCKHAAMRFGNQLWWSSALAKCSWWEAADSSMELDQHQTVEERMANWRFDTCIIDGRSEYNGVTKSLNPEKTKPKHSNSISNLPSDLLVQLFMES